MSNTSQESQRFIHQANAFPDKNPNLVLVNGALGGHTASTISNPSASGYTTDSHEIYNKKVIVNR